jgi:hypothetical protein
VGSDLQIKSPQAVVNVDRQKAAALALTAEQIRNTLYNSFGSRQVATIYTASNDYAVILEVDPSFQQITFLSGLPAALDGSGRRGPACERFDRGEEDEFEGNGFIAAIFENFRGDPQAVRERLREERVPQMLRAAVEAAVDVRMKARKIGMDPWAMNRRT